MRSDVEPEPELERRSEDTSDAVLGLVTTTMGLPMPSAPKAGATISLVVCTVLRAGLGLASIAVKYASSGVVEGVDGQLESSSAYSSSSSSSMLPQSLLLVDVVLRRRRRRDPTLLVPLASESLT